MAEVGQARALVAHQGDERRDDDGQVVAGERGQLVAEALAAAGRHHDERVAAVERGLDRVALARAEGGEAEQREQLLGRGVDRRAGRGWARRDGHGRGTGGPAVAPVGAGVVEQRRRPSGGGRRDGRGRIAPAVADAQRAGVEVGVRRRAERARVGLVLVGRLHRGEVLEVRVVVVARRARGRRRRRGAHAVGGQAGERRQRRAFLRRERAPSRPHVVERRGRAGGGGVVEDGGEGAQGAVHVFRA